MYLALQVNFLSLLVRLSLQENEQFTMAKNHGK
jgi:hypothetical protein